MKKIPSYNIELNKFFWIYVPILILVYPYLLNIPGLDIEKNLYREYGLIENLTAVFLAVAFVSGIRLSLINKKLIRYYYIFLSIGTFYFLGEELSWGQFLFKWETQGIMKELNRQSETNLHNLSGLYNELFAKIPRFIISVVALVSGFVVPVWFRLKRKTFKLNSIHHWIWPSFICSYTVIFANIVARPYKILSMLGKEAPPLLQIDYSEVKECFIALFICLYMLTSIKYFSLTNSKQDTSADQKK
jgi:hypothetical protein